MIRVLVVDDSALVRKVLTEQLEKYEDVEVVGSAVDPYVARDKIVQLRPDVITLDLEMPRMDGLTFLAKLMRHFPLPVVVVSSLTPAHSDAAVRALALGAVDVVCKPGSSFTVPEVADKLITAIRTAARAKVQSPATSFPSGVMTVPDHPDLGPPILAGITTTHKLLAVGASTGGTKAIEALLTQMPPGAPGMVIVQHMPAGFTASFAKRLSGLCKLDVREAVDGDVVTTGVVLIAPGDKHLIVQRSGAQVLARVKDGPPVHHQRPAVDVLFDSVARGLGRNAVGALLTGMGADGAKGLLAMHAAGAHTIAQDEESCVVFGMPREAIRLGATDEVLPLGRIAAAMLRAATRTPALSEAHA